MTLCDICKEPVKSIYDNGTQTGHKRCLPSRGERSTIIAQLAFTEGVNESVYKDYTDKKLQDRLEFLFGGDNDDKKD